MTKNSILFGLAFATYVCIAGGCVGQAVDSCSPDQVLSEDGDCLAGLATITSKPDAVTALTTARFEFMATGSPDATFVCALDGAAALPCDSGVEYTVAEGSHRFDVAAVLDGTTDPSPAEYSWTVDTTVPDTMIDSKPAFAVDASASVAVTFHSNDAQATFECSLDGAAYAACVSGAPLSGLAVGSHSYSVRAVDEAGNKDASPASCSWNTYSSAGEPAALAGITAAQNQARTGVGVAPLSWDAGLAAVAQAWVNQCVDADSNGFLDHNPNRSVGYPDGVGENIYASSSSPTVDAIVNAWVAEKANYDHTTNTCSGSTCAHYTQIVWANTTKVGCAVNLCPTLTLPYAVVCDYNPAGNQVGQSPY